MPEPGSLGGVEGGGVAAPAGVSLVLVTTSPNGRVWRVAHDGPRSCCARGACVHVDCGVMASARSGLALLSMALSI
eukprot:6411291-Prymnesium_polylepis.1